MIALNNLVLIKLYTMMRSVIDWETSKKRRSRRVMPEKRRRKMMETQKPRGVREIPRRGVQNECEGGGFRKNVVNRSTDK